MWTDRKHTGNDNNNDAQLLTCHMSTDTVKVIMLNRRHGIDDTNTHSSQTDGIIHFYAHSERRIAIDRVVSRWLVGHVRKLWLNGASETCSYY